MFKSIKYKEIEESWERGTYVLIDVRSPSEYRGETIPCAVNIPIFDDEERCIIGRVYNQESIAQAKKLGIEFASKRLPQIYDEISKLNNKYDKLLFFCARGGMRSGALVSLFNSIGINAYKLEGGYKYYRKYIYNSLPDLVKGVHFIVLYGNTGVGKTHILEGLESRGMDVLNLECCANHRGSILGGVGLGDQNTQKMFESNLYQSLYNRKSNLVFIEGESRRIGKDIIPEYLFKAMNEGINILIEAPMNVRIANISDSYIHNTDEELIESLEGLRIHIGDRKINRYIELINEHDYRPVIEELMVEYYDPLYEHNHKEYSKVFFNDGIADIADSIIKWANALILGK